MSIDTKINELFEIVKKQLAEVEKAEQASKSAWKTNCSFQMNGQPTINLQTADVAKVMELTKHLILQRDLHEKANAALDLSQPFTFAGYSFDDVVTDCKTRLAKLSVKEKRVKLDALNARLDAIVSPEQRRQMELEAITKELL